MARIWKVAVAVVCAAVLVVLAPRVASASPEGHCVIVENESPWVEIVVCEPWV